MKWNVIYNRTNLNSDNLIPSKNDIRFGEEIAEPFGGIIADNEKEAVSYAISYIREIMESNCLKCKKKGYTLTVCDSLDGSPIEKYSGFRCVDKKEDEA